MQADVTTILDLLEPLGLSMGPLTEAQAQRLRGDVEQLNVDEVIPWLDELITDTDGQQTVTVSRAQLLLFAAIAEKASHREYVLDGVTRIIETVLDVLLRRGIGKDIKWGELPEIVEQIADRFTTSAPSN